MKYTSPQSSGDVLLIFRHTIASRNQTPDRSDVLARDAFNATHPSRCAFAFDDALASLRFEMGALEAPGTPPDDSPLTQHQYEASRWTRLELLVEDAARSAGRRQAA